MTSEATSGPGHARGGARDGAARARRGFLLITGAKAWFLVSGTLLHLALPRLLGDPASFGDFGVVNTFIGILNMVVLAGALQATSKRVSESPGAARAIRARALRIQGLAGLGLLAIVGIAAGPLATAVFGDSTLAPHLRVAIAVTACYGPYASLVGLANGLERFDLQAALDAGYSTLKVALMAGLVWAGGGVSGAFAGFALTALVATAAAFLLTGALVASTDRGEPAPPLGGFLAQVLGYTLFVQLLVQADVLVVKHAALASVEGALTGPVPAWAAILVPDLADSADPARDATAALAGLFRATRNVSLIPYQAVIAVTFVAFPLLSRATAAADTATARATIREALRATLLLVLLLGTALGAGGGALLALLFGPAYALASPALLPLLGAMSAFAVFYVLLTLLAASGRARDALLLAAATAALDLALTWAAVRGSEPGPAALGAASFAVLTALATGLVLASLVAARLHGASLPVATLARTLASSALGLGAGALLPGEDPGSVFLRASAAASVYLLATAVTGEVGKRDLALLRDAFRRRRERP